MLNSDEAYELGLCDNMLYVFSLNFCSILVVSLLTWEVALLTVVYAALITDAVDLANEGLYALYGNFYL